MIVGALLANIVEAGTGVLTLAEDMDFATFQRSRLARAEIGRLVEEVAANLADLSAYRIVINTIPAKIFDATNLPTLDRGALLLDVASFPGGVDSGFAAKTGVQLLRAPGLPGRKAPETVAAAMAEIILAEIGQP